MCIIPNLKLCIMNFPNLHQESNYQTHHTVFTCVSVIVSSPREAGMFAPEVVGMSTSYLVHTYLMLLSLLPLGGELVDVWIHLPLRLLGSAH